MIQRIKKITFGFLGILIFNSCSVYKTETFIGKIGEKEYQNTVVKTNQFEGVIFSKDYIGFLNNTGKKYTPTASEIDSSELILRKGIKEINITRPNQIGSCPVIHRNLRKYKRQYFGYINDNGDKIIYINCFWDKEGFSEFVERVFYDEPVDNKWKCEENIVLDGCSYYWSIKVNLTTKRLFDFGVNGIG